MNVKCKVLTQFAGNDRHAGSKAHVDAYRVFHAMGCDDIRNYSQNNNTAKKNVWYYIQRGINCFKTYHELSAVANEYVFAQYPDYSPAIIQQTIYKFWQRNHTIFLIHDINSWRNWPMPYDEIPVLNSATALIVHNEKMKQRLIAEGVTKPYLVCLELFDYFVDGPVQPKSFQKSLVFAGNLGKSQFLPGLVQIAGKYAVDLYGIGLQDTASLPAYVRYHGSYPPETLPQAIDGGLGLVWDGTTIDTCSGDMGEYTRYNNPHKLSLYIATGIPFIVWKEAAVADLVRKYDIGYCVSNLREIDDIMENLTPERYAKLVDHIKPLQQKVLHGEFLTNAIHKVLQYMEKD